MLLRNLGISRLRDIEFEIPDKSKDGEYPESDDAYPEDGDSETQNSENEGSEKEEGIKEGLDDIG